MNLSRLLSILFIFFGLAIQAQSYTFEVGWARNYGSSQNEEGKRIAIDLNQRLVSAGQFSQTFSIPVTSGGSQSLVNQGQQDIYFKKTLTTGANLWAKRIGGSGNDMLTDLTLDGQGFIYLTGTITGQVDFDPGAGTYTIGEQDGSASTFIAKYNLVGDIVWAYHYKGCIINSIAVDGQNRIIITGRTFNNEAIDFDVTGGTSIIQQPGSSCFLVKYNSDMSLMWASGIQNVYATRVRVNALNAIYIAGFAVGNSTIDFDPGPDQAIVTTTTPLLSSFVAKYSAGGTYLWGFLIPPTTIRDLCVEPTGSFYITGSFRGTVDFDPSPATANITSLLFNGVANNNDAFVIKYTTQGSYVWGRQFGGSGNDVGTSLSFSADRLYVSFDNVGIAYLGGSPIGGEVDRQRIFLLELNKENGFYEFARHLGLYTSSIQQQNSNCIIAQTNGTIYLVGTMATNIDYGGGVLPIPLSSNGENDILIARYRFAKNPTGSGGTNGSCPLPVTITSITPLFCSDSARIHFTIPVSYQSLSYNSQNSGTFYTTSSAKQFVSADPGFISIFITSSNPSCFFFGAFYVGQQLDAETFDLTGNISAETFAISSPVSNVTLTYWNQSCQSSPPGTLKLVYDTQKLILDTAFNMPNQVINDTLIWFFPSINYSQTNLFKNLFFRLTDSAQYGDVVCFDYFILPQDGDANPLNNHVKICRPILASYDPNDKQVYPEGVCPEKYVLYSDSLNLMYTVRFQNTGDDFAVNVRIDDIPNTLFYTHSFILRNSSHPISSLSFTGTEESGVFRFSFNNIFLPPLSASPYTSRGHVVFELKPFFNPLLSQEDNMAMNQAKIYFDNNPPIITNMTSTRLVLTYDLDTIDTYLSGCEVVEYEGIKFDQSTTYFESIASAFDCDTIRRVNITVIKPVADITISDGTATTVPADTYQWIDCLTNLPIPGATSQVFQPTVTSLYKVIITINGCADTSVCVGLVADLDNIDQSDFSMVLYPNPLNEGYSTLKVLPELIGSTADLYDATGRKIHSEPITTTEQVIHLNINSGVYLVRLTTRDGKVKSRKWIKN